LRCIAWRWDSAREEAARAELHNGRLCSSAIVMRDRASSTPVYAVEAMESNGPGEQSELSTQLLLL
jgi:hypothetical protein